MITVPVRELAATSRPRPVPGQLLARPTARTGAGRPGLQTIGAGAPGREWLLYVPPVRDDAGPRPLVIALHGAGGDARQGIALLQPLADAAGLVVLAPGSQGATWDIIEGSYGPDVARLDQALAQVFAAHAVDGGRLAIAGFSDGASYALSLGLTNGDLFTHIIAFSPGFMAPTRHQGRPRVFIAHGVADRVLPIDRCSRRLVPRLRAGGHSLEYHEFPGGHVVPPDMREAAVAWFDRTAAPPPDRR